MQEIQSTEVHIRFTICIKQEVFSFVVWRMKAIQHSRRCCERLALTFQISASYHPLCCQSRNSVPRSQSSTLVHHPIFLGSAQTRVPCHFVTHLLRCALLLEGRSCLKHLDLTCFSHLQSNSYTVIDFNKRL